MCHTLFHKNYASVNMCLIPTSNHRIECTQLVDVNLIWISWSFATEVLSKPCLSEGAHLDKSAKNGAPLITTS